MTQNRWSQMVMPIRLALVALLLLPGLVTMPAALAQDESAPQFPAGVLAEDGIDVTVLGMGTVDVGDASGTHVTLERVSIQPETVFQPNPAETPALIVVESGAVLSEDERGFFSRIASPFQRVIPAGDVSTWTASEPVTFLRLGMTDKPPAPSSAEGIEIEVIASLVTGQPLSGPAQLYIASATLAPDMASVRLDQTGFTGVSVGEGTVEVLSPSGLEGRLETGTSIIFPQSAPMNLLGTAGSEATVLLFGMTDAPDAASVLTSTVTDVCRNRDAATCTPTDAVLANGETWQHPAGALTVNGSTGGSATWVSETSMTVELTYEHRGDEPVELQLAADAVQVTYDDGAAWTPEFDEGPVFSLAPGESGTATLRFAPPEGAGEGNVTISVPEFGAISGAQWQGFVELLTITPPESTLALGETWLSETASMTIAARPATAEESNQPERDIAVEVTYTNTGAEELGMTVSPSLLTVTSTAGTRWTSPSRGTTARIEPGTEQTFTFIFRSQPGQVGADLLIVVRTFAGIEDATWTGPSPLAN